MLLGVPLDGTRHLRIVPPTCPICIHSPRQPKGVVSSPLTGVDENASVESSHAKDTRRIALLPDHRFEPSGHSPSAGALQGEGGGEIYGCDLRIWVI